MSTPWTLTCCALGLLACSHHGMGDPGRVPIAPITHDAVFVVNGGDSSISVINAETDDVVGTIVLQTVAKTVAVGAKPNGIVYRAI